MINVPMKIDSDKAIPVKPDVSVRIDSDIEINNQDKQVTPSNAQQSITADSGYTGLGTVTVSAIASGTEGTPIATKGTVSNNSVSVTPSVTNTEGYIEGGTKTGTPVSVSASELVNGTKSISITQNGTTTEDVTNYASASIAVNVANSYTASDEGKVVSSGALVSQSSATYTENGTYDTTLVDGVTVNVSGSGGTELYDFIDNTLTELIDDDGNATIVTEYGCYKKTALTKIRLQGCASLGAYAFNGCSNVATIVLPSFSGNLTNREFQGCSSLKAIDLGGGNKINFSGQNNPPWLNDAQFDTLIIRKTDSIMTLSPASATAYTFNGTPFASSGSGGTLYVPSALVNTYKTATNWATWFADGGSHNNQVLSIESTHTDPNAPIDLTLYYADGTPIPTS